MINDGYYGVYNAMTSCVDGLYGCDVIGYMLFAG